MNFINEPRLYATFEAGKGVLQYTHLDNTLNGPLSAVSMDDGVAKANIPMKQYGMYLQDDWRVTDTFTLNLGVRYDYLTGYQYDQSKNPNFVKVQAAGQAGLLKGIKGLENAGLDPQEDKSNIQPRVGVVWDLRGDGKDVVRAGWGIYMDMAYTNSNGLFAAFDAQGAFGIGGRRVRLDGHQEPGRFLLPDRPADQQHHQPEPGRRQRAAALRPVGGSAAEDAAHAARRPSAGRTS